MTLSAPELLRYSRQLTLPEIGVAGQQRLRDARVLIVGAGGLGSPAALYLAAAGVGTLGLVDFDVVDASNLHRQLLHGTSDVGVPKVESAVARLREVNPHVQVRPVRAALSSANAMTLLHGWDLVLDGSDNFPTRYLVNDACVLLGVPFVYGSVQRFDGQVSLLGAPGGPCYRCLFREPPPPGMVPSCAEAGVFGVVPGLVGMLQATEAIKWITGVGEPLVGRLLLVDALRMRFRTIALRPDPACPVCGTREQTTLIDYEAFCGVRGGDVGAAPPPSGPRAITPTELAARLAAGNGAAPMVVDVRDPWEADVAPMPRATLIPLGEFAARIAEVPRDREVVLVCHHGMRSLQAARLLVASGHPAAVNLTGGIDRWSVEVDPSVPRY